jgi:flagella basal body P-ring formation protein FlgA
MLLALLFGGVTIKLLPQAHVRGAEIELASIAAVEGADAGEVARVKALKLGYAPAPGYSRVIVGARLSNDVMRLLPGVSVTLAGTDTCRVFPTTERITGAALHAAAKAEVERWFKGRQIELELISNVPDLDVPSGATVPELRAVLGATTLEPGAINVPVRIMVDGGVHRTVWTNWQLAIWEEASVLTRVVRAGETIGADALETRRVLTRTRGSDAMLSAAQLVGSTAKHELAIGVPLRDVDVERPLLVKRGDALLVEVRHGSVQARAAATVEQDARAGERVRVTLLDTKRSLNARIVSRDLAVIDLSTGS